MPPKVIYRITAGKKGGMLAIAIIADGIQLLFKFLWFTGILAILGEAVGWAISGLASLLLALAFAGSKVNPMSGGAGKVRTFFTVACEGMPLINGILPTFTIWTLLTIRQSRTEDKEKAVQSATIEQREVALRRGGVRRMRRDQGGRRPPRTMRRILRNIPQPAFRAARVVRESERNAPPKNPL